MGIFLQILINENEFDWRILGTIELTDASWDRVPSVFGAQRGSVSLQHVSIYTITFMKEDAARWDCGSWINVTLPLAGYLEASTFGWFWQNTAVRLPNANSENHVQFNKHDRTLFSIFTNLKHIMAMLSLIILPRTIVGSPNPVQERSNVSKGCVLIVVTWKVEATRGRTCTHYTTKVPESVGLEAKSTATVTGADARS